MTRTILERADGQTFIREGTGGLTVTSTRTGDEVNVRMEFDVLTHEEGTALVAMLLAQLEELKGERFVANCLAHYAEATGKEIRREEGQMIVRVRGKKR